MVANIEKTSDEWFNIALRQENAGKHKEANMALNRAVKVEAAKALGREVSEHAIAV